MYSKDKQFSSNHITTEVFIPKNHQRNLLPLHSFELVLAGVILLTAMAAGAVSLWIKRKKGLETNQTFLPQEPTNHKNENKEQEKNTEN